MPLKLFHSLFGSTSPPVVSGSAETRETEKRAQFIAQLLQKGEDRRRYERVPFCCPVTLYFDNLEGPIPGLARDLSEAGMGFVLDVPVSLGEVTVRIPTILGHTICARMDLLWCRPAMRHCYICGGEFITVFVDDPIKL